MKFYKKWKSFLTEAEQDAKVLRKINVDQIKKEMPQHPDEEIRDYFARIQGLERNPEYLNPIFPQGLVDWVESLPDNHFPTNGRKRFAKWLANSIYYQETEIQGRLDSVDNPNELRIYNNDVRYIADYLNGADEFPENLWNQSLNGMYDLAVEWHDTLKYKEDPTGDYQNKDVVYKFENGFTIVDVNTENDLEVEGEKMGHCVGSYCDYVASGETIIYSLRDKRNNPHATIEVVPTLPLGRTRSRGRVDQIKGKGNAAPVEKYRPMIKQWLQTTDFNYENSPDYLNILSQEEIKQKLFSGELTQQSEQTMALTSQNPEIINFFLQQIMETDRVVKINEEGIVNALVRNVSLNEEQRLNLIKINFQHSRPLLGVRIGHLMGALGHRGEINFDPKRLSSLVWQELGEELKSTPSDEKLYCMQALMELEEADTLIKEQILNHLLSEEYLTAATDQPEYKTEQQQQPYGAIIQAALFQKSPGRDQVKRIYMMQRDSRFVKALGQIGRINGYIASSRGMSDDLADEIIKDVKLKKTNALQQNHWIDMIVNAGTSDSRKIELLNIAGERSIVSMTQPNEPTRQTPGLKWSVAARSMSRRLYEAAREKKFSKKIVKYMIDAGVFDPQYAMVWVGQRTKLTGSRPNIEQYSDQEKQKLIELVRNRALGELESGIFDEDLFEEMNKYFRKNIMTKDKFYDSIEETIKEEKGRSRQRGIYKFYCMLSYGLTLEENKSRGLDDILADLRALPNVTIVTVVVKNQKIAEGKYIAGLSLKFIPSIPGQFRSPEDVKARIVRDIKRLGNVQNVFKISSGLERLE